MTETFASPTGQPATSLRASTGKQIYVYTTKEYENAEWKYRKPDPNNPTHKGYIKIGDTREGRTFYDRVGEDRRTGTAGSLKDSVIPLFFKKAEKKNGTLFDDHALHRYLEDNGYIRIPSKGSGGKEWFEMTVDEFRQAFEDYVSGKQVLSSNRKYSFPLRPEQIRAIEKTVRLFNNPNSPATVETPANMLWNAKMRFGKTFTSYQLAKKLGYKKILVLTYKPATQDAWREDLLNHNDFFGWLWFGAGEAPNKKHLTDPDNPMICFASFQDIFTNPNDKSSLKPRHEYLTDTEWDIVIIDEYHYGAWNDKTKNFYNRLESSKLLVDKDTFDSTVEEATSTVEDTPTDLDLVSELGNDFTTEYIQPNVCSDNVLKASLKSKTYLYLSGTPFRALAEGEFTSEEICNWTYMDEQKAKQDWLLTEEGRQGEPNPYRLLPKMKLCTYEMPDNLKVVAENGQNEFSLNELFRAEMVDADENDIKNNPEVKQVAKFVHEETVLEFLVLLRNDSGVDKTKKKNNNFGAYPYASKELRQHLRHTFWLLPSVAACNAMERLLIEPGSGYDDSTVIVAAGDRVGSGADALIPVREAITNDGLKTKTITLSCGKLTTGVTVPEWSAVFMLWDVEAPETYFQTAFRCQSPYRVEEVDTKNGGIKEKYMKENCWVFDFAPNRTLNLIAEYAHKTALYGNEDETSTEEGETGHDTANLSDSVSDFLSFLPVICHDGYIMEELNAGTLLDYISLGSQPEALANRWRSSSLIDVRVEVLSQLAKNPELLERIDKIDAFRKLNKPMSIVIASEERLEKVKKSRVSNEHPKGFLTEEEQAEEKENKKIKKEWQEKLTKFLMRMPDFMYLTDFREESVRDVILKFETDLFTQVTGLTQDDFQELLNLGVFNEQYLNSNILAFRRFEDSPGGSLDYLEILETSNPRMHHGYTGGW